MNTLQSPKSAESILKNPIMLLVLVIMIVFGMFGAFFLGARVMTGHWPVQSKSPSIDDKW